MRLKIGSRGLIALVLVLILSACGYGASATSSTITPAIVSFNKIGTPISSTEVNTIFAQTNKIFVSINASTPESNGLVNYLIIADNATSSTPYLTESLTYDAEKYFQFGNIVVNDAGLIYLPVAESAYTGYALLRYSSDNLFESAIDFSSESWVKAIFFGAFDENNLYLNAQSSTNNGDLVAIPLISAPSLVYSKLFPFWYGGEFAVNNNNLYYANINGVFSNQLTSTESTQVGLGFNLLPSGINAALGMLDLYQGNIYIGAIYTQGQTSYLAVCVISATSNSNTPWSCSYDPNVQINSTEYITNFRVGASSGNIIAAVNDYGANTTQLYVLNKSNLAHSTVLKKETEQSTTIFSQVNSLELLPGSNCSDGNLSNDHFVGNSTGIICHNANFTNSYLGSPLNFTNADLFNTNFTNALFVNDELFLTFLSSANLTNSKWNNVNASYAFLVNANLFGASLTDVNFTNANLSDANFTNANLINTNFSGANLSGAIWIDGQKCKSSSISHCNY